MLSILMTVSVGIAGNTLRIQDGMRTWFCRGFASDTQCRDNVDSARRMFVSMEAEMYQRYNAVPEPVDIYLSGSAWEFQRLTGKRQHVAGIYDSQRRIFVIQRPEALRTKGALREVVAHEMMHRILSSEYIPTTTSSHHMVLEEIFCHTYYPVSGVGTCRIIAMENFQQWLENTGKLLQSSSADEQYCGMENVKKFGEFISASISEKQLYRLVLQDNYEELEPYYNKWRDTLRR